LLEIQRQGGLEDLLMEIQELLEVRNGAVPLFFEI
jgi:hypothetical protein